MYSTDTYSKSNTLSPLIVFGENLSILRAKIANLFADGMQRLYGVHLQSTYKIFKTEIHKNSSKI